MDFYNLQERDHRLLEKTMSPAKADGSASAYQEYLARHFFNFERVLDKKCILIAEEDPRVQQAMQRMILEANKDAACWIVDAVEEVEDVLAEKGCDLLIANYYLSEDEIDYEFWEGIRARYPQMEVIILSHVNDREYYEVLERVVADESRTQNHPLTSRIKNFFGTVFGG